MLLPYRIWRVSFVDMRPWCLLPLRCMRRSRGEHAPRTGPAFLASLVMGALLFPASVSGAGSLADLSIEELMNESVTSVSKREQRVGDVAAAIAVLSHDEIERSGATSVAAALRSVPGMNVGSANAGEWAVSARGFNDVFSKNLLVLVDGRAVYSPVFGGVFWDLQQTMLEDVDRIEVIRGPGATVWGANAVNGVINVVSRRAEETQGGFVYAGGGDQLQSAGGMRYGGRLGAQTFFRVFGSVQSQADHRLANGQPARDAWRGRHGGLRLDHHLDEATLLTWQADATGVARAGYMINSSNFNTLGRWTRHFSPESSLEVQAYYDRTSRDDTAQARLRTDTFDLSVEQTLRAGARQELVWGVGYRYASNAIAPNNPLLAVRNPDFGLRLFSAFVQDEWRVIPDRVALTAGVKLEHNDYTGFEVQPSIRALFKPAPAHTLWASVSRAVRTPNTVEGQDSLGAVFGAPFPGPGGGQFLPTAVGNGNPDSEVLWAYEIGYRAQPWKRVHLDLTAFRNAYSRLINYGGVASFVPGFPFGVAEIPAVNLFDADSHGAEATLVVAVTDSLRFTFNYSWLRMRVGSPPGFLNTTREKSAPRHQSSLRLAYDFFARGTLDVQLRDVGAIDSVPEYVTADGRLSWRLGENVVVALVGQNLTHGQHLEQGPVAFTTMSAVPRSYFGKLTWRF